MDKRFNLLPKEMKDAISGLKELHNTPDSMAIVCVLSVANMAAARLYNVESYKYGPRPINEFFVNLAGTGARKSTNFRELTFGISQYEELRQDELKNESVRYALDEKRYKKKLKEYEASLDDENGVPLPIPNPPKAIETAEYQVQTGTRNGIMNILKSQSFAGLLSSEAGEFFSSHSFKDKNSAVELAAFLTLLWDGSPVKKQTGMESMVLKNRRMTMSFLLQSEVFQDVMNNSVFSEQGFMHRILITQSGAYKKVEWVDTPEAREREQQAKELIGDFNVRIFNILNRPHRTLPGRYDLDPIVMESSEDAKALLIKFYNDTLNFDENELRNYAGFAQRLHEHAIRLAATLAAFELSDVIEKHHAECAIQLMNYFVEQRRNLEIGVTNWNQTRSDGANKLLNWIIEKQWTGTKRELNQYGPSWYNKLNVEQKDQILEDLLREEAIMLEEGLAKNGRKVTMFKLAEH